MTKAQMENAIRNRYLDAIRDLLTSQGDEALTVSASELAIPCLDDAGNEAWAIVKVSIPRGTRNGEGGYTPYDGYAAAEDYAIDCADKAQKKAEAQAKKQAKIAKDEQKRAEKKALAEANKGLKELRKIPIEPADDYAKEYTPEELTAMLN